MKQQPQFRKNHLALAVVSAACIAAMSAAQASTPGPVPSGNDVGCPNTSTKTGVYAPCVGYLPAGATSASQARGVHHLSVEPGVLQTAITPAQAAAKGLMPGNLGTPSFGVLAAVSLTGGAGQQNPTSSPMTAQQFCGTSSPPGAGVDGFSASTYSTPGSTTQPGTPFTWSGWDNLLNMASVSTSSSYNATDNGWNYGCTYTPQPTQQCTYISGYDASGNPIYTNYTAYGAWSWGNGNNGSWSQPSCSRPNAPTPPPPPAPAYNPPAYTPPAYTPPSGGSATPTGGGGSGSGSPPPPPAPVCPNDIRDSYANGRYGIATFVYLTGGNYTPGSPDKDYQGKTPCGVICVNSGDGSISVLAASPGFSIDYYTAYSIVSSTGAGCSGDSALMLLRAPSSGAGG